jgi:putative ABC transport system permease protein
MLHDLRYALRILRKSPGFTAIAVLALGLGVGVNTAVYSLTSVLIYRPLLVPDLDRLITVQATREGSNSSQDVSAPDLVDWRAESHTVENLAAVSRRILTLTGGGEPVSVVAGRVSPAFFDALGVKPSLGRAFLPAEEKPGNDRVLLLSHSLWQARYQADAAILGRTLKLNGEDYQVLGVMPRDFEYPPGVQLWVPAAFTNDERSAHASFSLELIGRLKSGASLAQADAEFRLLAQRSARKYPDSHAGRSARVALLREFVNGDEAKPFMRMLTGAVLFVLLIACANVAGLQFARISLRTREVAVRSAVGAARSRLIRQFLVESLLLGGLGALAGLAFAQWGTSILRGALPASVARYVPGWSRLAIDGHALIYAIVTALAAGIAAGIAPAWLASKASLLEGLREGGRGMSGGRARQRIRGILVVTEIVLAAVLLIGAGLMVSGVQNLTEPAPGIRPERALILRVSLPETRYPTAARQARFEDQLLLSLASLPGAESAALSSALPYASGSHPATFVIEGRPLPKPGTEPAAQRQAVSVDYFQNLRIRLLRGRLFDARDGETAPPVALISQHLARRYFAGENPIGQRLRIGQVPWCTIIGVVADIRRDPWDHDIAPVIYRPFLQDPSPRVHFLVRAAGDPNGLVPAARAQLARLDPDQPVEDIKTYRKAIDDRLVGLRYVASMMAVFGALALLLSAVGVYGITAYSVSERTHEIGLRKALGAQDRAIVWMVARWGILLLGCGLALGVPAALGLASLLQNLVFGVGAYDPVSFISGILLLAVAAFAACYLPVRRALSVDPIVTLRAE